jgi:hypothetical protein
MNAINSLCGYECFYGCFEEQNDVDSMMLLLKSTKWFETEGEVRVVPIFIITLQEYPSLIAINHILSYFLPGQPFNMYSIPMILFDAWFVENESHVDKSINFCTFNSLVNIVNGQSLEKRVNVLKQIISYAGKTRVFFGGLTMCKSQNGFQSKMPSPNPRMCGSMNIFPRNKILDQTCNIEKTLCFYCGEFQFLNHLTEHEESCTQRYIYPSQATNIIVLIPLDKDGLNRSKMFGKCIPFENTNVLVATLPLYKSTLPPNVLSIIRNHLGKWNNGMIQQYLWQDHLNYLADMHPYTKMRTSKKNKYWFVSAFYFADHKHIMKPIHLPDTVTCFYNLKMPFTEWNEKPLFHSKWYNMQLCRTIYFSHTYKFLESIPIMLSLLDISKKRTDWTQTNSTIDDMMKITDHSNWNESYDFPFSILNGLLINRRLFDIDVFPDNNTYTTVDQMLNTIIQKCSSLSEYYYIIVKKNICLWLKLLGIIIQNNQIAKHDIMELYNF